MGVLCSLPAPDDVRAMLSELLDAEGDVDARPRAALGGDDAAAGGVYVSDPGALAAVVACDVRAGAALGAALALLPAELVAEAEQAGALDGDVMDNLREVFTVLTTGLTDDGRRRVTLDSVHVAPEPLPEPVARLLDGSAALVPMAVSVPGYGDGVIALAVR